MNTTQINKTASDQNQPKDQNQKRILYIFDSADWKSRMPLARAAKADGYRVSIGLMGARPDDLEALKGFHPIHIPRPQARLNIMGIGRTILALRATIERLEPDIVHAVTLKYSFFTGLAGRKHKKSRFIYTLAGLGYLFRGGNRRADIMRKSLSQALKAVLRDKRAVIIFQNPDDQALLIRKKYVRADQTRLIIGSGVDLEKFSTPQTCNDPNASHTGANSFDGPPLDPDSLLVLMPTRLVQEKGIRIFIKAARLLKSQYPHARFQIAGGLTEHNPRAFTKEKMEALTQDGATEWIGHVNDMPALLQRAAIIVYPSYYGEGVPRVLLEACAAGKPIVTTDHPGCREAISRDTNTEPEGKNGFLVPIQDVGATAAAIQKLLDNKTLRHDMGKASRHFAEDKFDIWSIVRQTLDVYKTL